MTHTFVERNAPAKSPVRQKRKRAARVVDWIAGLVIIAGTAVLLYPTAGQWFTDGQHSEDIAAYVQQVRRLSNSERELMLQRARDYNADLPPGQIADPYTSNALGDDPFADPRAIEYFSHLRVEGTDAMARISVPSVGIDLAIYHNTDDVTLMRGAGHLYGTALPVGGDGSHAVITAHSGIPNARFFTDLEDVVLGDTFTVLVGGRQLAYEVDQIKVVLPTEIDDLAPVAGEDYVTLISCTPLGVNSHRLLVRGTRIPPPYDEGYAITSEAPERGFPWWTVGIGASLIVAALVIKPGKSRPKIKPREA